MGKKHLGKRQPDGSYINPPNGVPEEIIEWRMVDNGARKKSDKWRHAYRMDRDLPQGQQICGSKLKRGLPDAHNVYFDDEGKERRRRCARNSGLFASGRCYRHGGTTEGAAIVTGRYIKSPIGPLGRAEERAKADRQMLDLRPVIGLFDERLTELSERIESEGDTPAFRAQCLRLYKDWEQADKDDDEKMAKHFRKELKLMLQTGVRGDRAWTELLNTAERRGTRAEKANLVLIKGHEVISKREMTWTLARMLDIIGEEANGAAVARIQQRVSREILERIDPDPRGPAAPKESAPLPGVPGEGTGVSGGSAGGKTLEVSAVCHGTAIPEREGDGADIARSGEDESSSVDSADVPDDTDGQHRDLNSPNRPPSEEPPVGGDREDAREGEAGTPW